jgi:hypothetical protein
MSDRCDRCGEVGEDRRTLWMACLYDMLELNIPFTQRAILGVLMKHVRDKELVRFVVRVPEFEPVDGDEPKQRNFFTLVVCKDCRGEWMAAIRAWFLEPKARHEPDDEHNIPIRRLGRTVFVSRAEWERLQKPEEVG